MHGAHDGRYAPSPTGRLHLGNLRTALVAWLRARQHGARFLLRIDDLDPDRSRADHERVQVRDLQRLGLDWDGPPVRQSERVQRYADGFRQLEALELAYPCFCSRAEVRAAASAPHAAATDGAYPGTCARIAAAAARRRVESGEPHAMRARAGGRRVGFDDLRLGRVEAPVDDFVLRRRDGVFAYNLASPLDEHDLCIGEVVRGADLAATTPRQLWVCEVLGLRSPRFAHVPLVVGPDGARLAKRDGSASLDELAALGMTVPAAISLLARSLGVTVDGDLPRTAADLLDRFRWDRLPLADSPIVAENGSVLGSSGPPAAPL